MRGGRGVTPKISRKRASLLEMIKKVKRIDTQTTRKTIIKHLKKLIKIAHNFATDKSLSLKDRREWARLEAYLAQTLNSIAKTYDMMQIKRQVEELKRLVDQELREGAREA